jgi:hypothetical protein
MLLILPYSSKIIVVLKMQVFAFKTHIWCITIQPHVSATVSSHHQADLKDIKKE